MELSKHNIISQLAGSDNYFVVNLLSQNADIIGPETFRLLNKAECTDNEIFEQKGYLVDPLEEEALYRKKYLDFLDVRGTEEVQLFFVPTYSCNFACSYCYQNEYENLGSPNRSEIIPAFFNYIDKTFQGRKKYLTLFGGEPLLDTPSQKEFIRNFIDRANERNLDIAIVTNAYCLENYIPIIKKASIREVQVTLDGTEETHNSRRPIKNGIGTFNKIVDGIDAALAAGFPVNLRMVIDKQNVEELPKLAAFAIERGWTQSPLFKTQLGRNYELHHCQTNTDRLYTRLGMYADIYRLLKTNPEIMEFHKPAFSVSRFLFEQGELPAPLFDSCPGTKTEWAFDYRGNIYTCTATIGKKGEELGTFFPEVHLLEDRISEWEERDVLAIEECKGCFLQLACGGGCGAVAKNRNGKICSADCRPVKELLSLGISHYFGNETIAG